MLRTLSQLLFKRQVKSFTTIVNHSLKLSLTNLKSKNSQADYEIQTKSIVITNLRQEVSDLVSSLTSNHDSHQKELLHISAYAGTLEQKIISHEKLLTKYSGLAEIKSREVTRLGGMLRSFETANADLTDYVERFKVQVTSLMSQQSIQSLHIRPTSPPLQQSHSRRHSMN